MNIIAKTTAIILEVSSSFYPEKTGNFSPDQNYILPSQETWVEFAGSKQIVCGPSPFINTLNCFSSKYKNYVKSIPIPGNASTTPIFIDNTWVIGTTKGFLFRVHAESEKQNLPAIKPESLEFWGSYSRQFIEDFAPKTIYKEPSQSEAEARAQHQQEITKIENYKWIFPTSSPFIGTPIIKDNIFYGITASQSLQAIDFETGKLLWSTQLGSQSSFRIANNSLRVTNTRLLVASNRGELLSLHPRTGDQISQTMIGNARDQENRFPDIVAAPLLTDSNHIIVSNSISTTKKLELDTFNTVWTYPAGSINTPLRFNQSTIILLTSDGNAVSLNQVNGTENWKTELNTLAPISAATFTNSKKTILIANQRGELFALDTTSGKILTQNRSIGSVIGNFFQLADHPQEHCLSFSTGSFRCFKVKR